MDNDRTSTQLRTTSSPPLGRPMTPARSRYLRPQVAATVLGVSPDRLRRLAETGRIGTLRTIGGHRRYRLDDIEAVSRWLERRSPRTTV
jgi:excisionase family DNA binding protein